MGHSVEAEARLVCIYAADTLVINSRVQTMFARRSLPTLPPHIIRPPPHSIALLKLQHCSLEALHGLAVAPMQGSERQRVPIDYHQKRPPTRHTVISLSARHRTRQSTGVIRLPLFRRTCPTKRVAPATAPNLGRDVSWNVLESLTFHDIAPVLSELTVDGNWLSFLPGTMDDGGKVLLPSLKTLSAKTNRLSTRTISAAGKCLPETLETLLIDDNKLVADVPDWVYRRNFRFSALPVCKRGEVLVGSQCNATTTIGCQCKECDHGSYAITAGGEGKTCQKCGEDRICDGGFNVLPEAGWWRSVPYFRTPIGQGRELYNGSVDSVTIFSGDALWDDKVHIYPCPNPDACLTSVDNTSALAYSYCKDGHTGPACALCDASHVWLEGHRCVSCEGSTGSLGWLVTASVLTPILGCVLLYVTTARPLFRTVEERIVKAAKHFVASFRALFPTSTARAGSARSAHSGGGLGQMKDRFKCWKERFDVKGWRARFVKYYEIYTKQRATLRQRKATVGAMNRSAVGFLQVNGNLGKLSRWPTEFRTVTSWFAFFKLSFDVPTVGCVIHRAFEYTFYDRLLLYCLVPVAIIAVLNLPLAWALLRKVPTTLRDEVSTRCVNWTLRVLFVVYPMVSQLVISALVCKQLGPDLWLLSYDYRVNCLEARYEEVKKFALAMLALWTIGYPLSMLIVMKIYRVPDMARRKQRRAELHALCWHTLRLSPVGPPRRPNQQRVAAATSDPLETTTYVPEDPPANTSEPTRADQSEPPATTADALGQPTADPSDTAEIDEPNPPPTDVMTDATTDWLAGEAGTLRELRVDTLTWLCDAHELEVGAVGAPGADAMAAALERLTAQLIDFEELAVPRVKWDPESADKGERLACAHIGSLFESYEPEWWWYASYPTGCFVQPPFRFSASNGSFS